MSISSTILVKSADSLVLTYLHETAHRLLERYPSVRAAHSGPFFALNLSLLLRLDRAREEARTALDSATKPSSAGAALAASSMSLYDIANLPEPLRDTPDGGLGRAMTWSTGVAAELALLDLDAEDVAAEVVRRYEVWLERLQNEPAVLAAQRAQAVRYQAKHEDKVAVLQEKLWVRNLAILVLSTVLLVMFSLLWRLA